MSTLLRHWDEGSKSKRKQLLEWFCQRFDPKLDGGDLLESECGADVALFLPRLLSWMQKTTGGAIDTSSNVAGTNSKPARTQKCFALSEQVACLQVFFATANVQTYYREFQHADGLRLLLHIVALDASCYQKHKAQSVVSATDREALLGIILRISQMGHQHKEEISRLGGELAAIRGVLASSDVDDRMAESRLWTLCREVLLEQLVGNPAGMDQAHEAMVFMLQHVDVRLQLFGAQVLREVITAGSFSFDPQYRTQKERELVPLCMALLNSPDVYLQHEGLELVHVLLQSRHLQDPICEALVILIGDAARALDKVEERFALIQDTTEFETYAHLHSPFVHVSQAISALMRSNHQMLAVLVDRYELLTPLAFVLVMERPHSLKWHAAAITTHYIAVNHRKKAAKYLAELFDAPMADLLAWKDPRGDEGQALAEFLLHDDEHQRQLVLQFYQRGWHRPLSPRRQSLLEDTDGELNDIEASLEAATRDYIPELQLRTRFCEDGEAFDAGVLEDLERLEAQHEHRLRVQLQKHFAKFRHVSGLTAGD